MFDSAARLMAVAFTLAAIILAARWLTVLTAPRPVAELPSAPMNPPEWNTQTVSRLFGSGPSMQSQALEGLHLTGVFAGSRGGGFATIHTRSGDVPVFPGDEVAPGVILKQIESDRVILSTSGVQRELPLREGNASATASTPLAAASTPRASASSPQPVRPSRRQQTQAEEE